MHHPQSLREASLHKGVRAVVRADFDVITRKIGDNFKIKECLPTFKYVLRKGASLRIITHIGRPRGHAVKNLSVRRFAGHLEKLLGRRVVFISDPRERKSFVRYAFSPEVLLFENMRFFKEEEENDARFAGLLARWGDIYINEAFANSHRLHASMVALARRLPPYAGLRLTSEITNLGRVLAHPRRPLVAISGGKKLETKLPLIEKFLDRGGEVLLGGTLANTLFHVKGFGVGKSAADREFKKELRHVLGHHRLFLPVDLLVARGIGGRAHLVPPDGIGRGETIYDIGPETVRLFESRIRRAKTVLWNGPMGIAEFPKFSYGTRELARSIQKTTAFKVVGGGDTVALLKKYRLLRGFSHASTGGGAMLEFLAGKKLPGIEALKNSKFKTQNSKIKMTM